MIRTYTSGWQDRIPGFARPHIQQTVTVKHLRLSTSEQRRTISETFTLDVGARTPPSPSLALPISANRETSEDDRSAVRQVALRDRAGVSQHDLRLVAKYCDRVAVMYGGAVVENGKGDRIFSHPVHPYTEALVKAAPGTEQMGGQIEAIPGRPPLLRERSEQCPFAPRCHMAVDVCRNQRPQSQVLDGRHVSCHRAEEILIVDAAASRNEDIHDA